MPSSFGRRKSLCKGRQKRVIDASILREKVLHGLDERNVPPELWNNPRAKRFFRFVREEVELQEARVRVLEHYEEVIALEDEATCQCHLVAASTPEPLIERCYVGVVFLAYLAASRFADHIPYYREEDILARVGFSIHRATQWRWMRVLAGIVLPLVELMRQCVMQSWVQGIDETPCDILPLIDAGPHPQAAWILGEIQKLYDIEDRARDMTDDHRLALRQAESRPIVTGIKVWLDARDQDELPKSPLRAGVNYFRNRWEAFERFLEDGRIPIDNNRTEAAIKGPVMGKKAWLFFGNENAGETAAIFYTLTMTCKRHCIDVQAYLLDVFRRIRTATPAELESLLPDHWIQSHPEARVVQRVQESHAAAARKRQRRAQRRIAVPSG